MGAFWEKKKERSKWSNCNNLNFFFLGGLSVIFEILEVKVQMSR